MKGLVFVFLFFQGSSSFVLKSRRLRSYAHTRPSTSITSTRKSHCGTTRRLFNDSSRLLAQGDDDDSESSTRPDDNDNQMLSFVGSTTSTVVSVIFFTMLAWKRDALMVSFFMGAIGNGIASKVLKKIIGASRPPELATKAMKLKPSDGGMPSSHAMSLGFIGTFTSLCLPFSRAPLVLYVLVSLIYRVQANLHTWQQIAVGLVVGSCNGVFWWNLCVGENPWRINLLAWTTSHILNEQGLLAWPLLAIPALLGLVVVGSFERRLSHWLKKD
jgi:hypothetical protein